MGIRPTTAEVFEFLQSPEHMHGTLGYLDQTGHPDSAFVAFSATDSLSILFGTSDQSRKYRLLKADRRVSFNVTDKVTRHTVQIKGVIVEITSIGLGDYEPSHYAKLGEASRRFKDLPDQHFFLLEPTWLRFSDCLEEPWTTTLLIG